MIPLYLQDGLKERMTALFETSKFQDPDNPDNNDVSLNIFEQHLPEKPSDDVSLYPYIIIQLSEGEQIREIEEPTVKVDFIIGVFNDEDKYQGYRDVANIIITIHNELKKRPLVNQQYELTFPIRWRIHDEDVSPYYFGGIETNWKIPNQMRKDVENLT